jgi:ribosome biogenesis GTPase
MTTKPLSTGIVLTYHSNFYTVLVDRVQFECSVKGLLKKEGVDVLVGDHVSVDNLDTVNHTGRITEVLPRLNQLERPKIANITRAVVVASIAQPDLDLMQLDRYLTRVYLAGIDPVICITKIDLSPDHRLLQTIASVYKALNIPIFLTSVAEPESIGKLFSSLTGQTVVLAGQSGVGKSTLLNAIKPDLDLAVGKVSDKIQRGQHTTRQVSLIALDSETYVADSPGFSYLKFDTVLPQALEKAFPDFEPYRGECRFDDCLHLDESGCAVSIATSRYENYRQFQQEAALYAEEMQARSQKETYGYKTLSQKGKGPDLKILRLKEKQRDGSRRTQKQQLSDVLLEDDTLEES